MFKNIFFRNSSRQLLRNLFTDEFSCFRGRLYQLSKGFKPKAANQSINAFPFIKNHKYSVILYGSILTALGFKEKTPEEKEEDLIIAIKWGIYHMMQSEYDKAEKQLHEALKMATNEKNSNGITYIYDVMANLAFERKQYEKAEKLYLEVMQRLLGNGLPPDDNKIVHMSLKLAKIYQSQKNYEKADSGYKFCMEHMKKKIQDVNEEDTLLLWANTLDWYGRYLIDCKKEVDEGITCLRKAYEICIDVNGKKHEQTIVMLNDLGTYSNMIGDGDSAINYLKEAAKIGDDFPDMKDLASIYVNLGQLYLSREMFKESETACQEGLKKAKENENKEAIVEANLCLKELYKFYTPEKVTT